MTQDQVMGVLRWVLPFLGGMAVGKGWLTSAQVSDLTNVLLQAAGPIAAVGGVVWSIIANSKKSIVKSVVQMPEVKSMTIVDPNLVTAAREAAVDTRVLDKSEEHTT